MTTSHKKTIGEYSYELQQKPDEKINPIDLQREVHKGNTNEDSFENQIRLTVERGEKVYEKDFFVVVLFRKERLKGLQNVLRQQFFHRRSCPTPEFDQTVYKYHKNDTRLEYLWTIPNWQWAHYMQENKFLFPLDQQVLIQLVDDFFTGKLNELCAKLNKEEIKNSS